jgi:hypothetical protein
MDVRRYEIRVAGRLAADWSEWFAGLEVRRGADAETVLSGPLDQAGLHGVLARIRDLGLTLVEVRRRDAPGKFRPR